jgi:peptidoglycan-associated lipoprotein
MTRKSNLKTTAIHLVLVGVAAASLAACASKAPTASIPAPLPKPQPPVVTPTRPTVTPTQPTQPTRAVPGSVQDFLISAGDRVYFDFDSYTIRPDARPVLDAQAAWLSRYPQVVVRIDGNADERGTVDYNFALGARRANAVRDYLVSRGVGSSRIETVSYGKSRPIDPRSNEEGWAVNRNGHTNITGGAR